MYMGKKTLAPWAGDYWGNGGQWAAAQRQQDSVQGSQPCWCHCSWNDGGYGHVAVATAVHPQQASKFLSLTIYP